MANGEILLKTSNTQAYHMTLEDKNEILKTTVNSKTRRDIDEDATVSIFNQHVRSLALEKR